MFKKEPKKIGSEIKSTMNQQSDSEAVRLFEQKVEENQKKGLTNVYAEIHQKDSQHLRSVAKRESKPLCSAEETEMAINFRGKTFSDFEVDKDQKYEGIKRLATGYVDKWNEPLSDEEKGVMGLESFRQMGFYFWSENPGSGKSLLACIIANEIYRRYGVSSQAFTMSDIFYRIKRTFNNTQYSEDAVWNLISYMPLLIVDEFAFEQESTSWKEEVALRIVDIRYNAKKPTIFTSNSSLGELAYHSRIKSRIKEMCVIQEFPDYDHRLDKGQSRQNMLLKKIMD